jgi:hypothetical protein
MKKYILAIMIALAFMACKETTWIGGTVTDFLGKDSIEGIEMGLYRLKSSFSYENKKWSDMELLETSTSNSDGYFSFEIDADMDIFQRVFYYPLLPKDTLSANAKYSTWAVTDHSATYNKDDVFPLKRATSIQLKLVNFTQRMVKMNYEGFTIEIHRSMGYSSELDYWKLLSGRKYKFDFYTEAGDYLGSTSPYIKTQLPTDKDQVEWMMPGQIIEVDFNTLVKE